jgi:hypothetical protein
VLPKLTCTYTHTHTHSFHRFHACFFCGLWNSIPPSTGYVSSASIQQVESTQSFCITYSLLIVTIGKVGVFQGEQDQSNFFFFAVLGFELRAYTFSHFTSPRTFCDVFFFKIVFCEVFALDWLWTSVLLISASWLARIIGKSHECLADQNKFNIAWIPC